ncbi:unnamed protein product [Lactuca virosa]|uniref:Uncharacterized protein n=1 Tax=Lactuca virosa TaxID=75947 RepID=A0AAU9PTD3_9ASTR|nr:unnamed protein product [Lactuca virosa]
MGCFRFLIRCCKKNRLSLCLYGHKPRTRTNKGKSTHLLLPSTLAPASQVVDVSSGFRLCGCDDDLIPTSSAC